MTIHKAVIPAGGWGTRFLPATKSQPKEMLPIVDKPAIQYVVEEAVASGITEIIIITRQDRGIVEDYFTRSIELETWLCHQGKTDLLEAIKSISNLAKIHFVREKHPRGLGYAVASAWELVGDEPFAVLLPDDIVIASTPCLKQMLDLYDKLHSPIIAVQKIPLEDVQRYGIINPETNEYPCCLIRDLVEKPSFEQSPSDLAIIGRYILTPAIFPLLVKASPGIGGEIQLTDSLRILAHQEKIYGYQFYGTRFDVGDKLGFIMANLTFALQRSDLKPRLKRYLENLVGNNRQSNLYLTEANRSMWDKVPLYHRS